MIAYLPFILTTSYSLIMSILPAALFAFPAFLISWVSTRGHAAIFGEGSEAESRELTSFVLITLLVILVSYTVALPIGTLALAVPVTILLSWIILPTVAALFLSTGPGS